MSVNYVDKTTGDLIRVAGQGKAEYGASTVRKGRVSTPAISAGGGQSVQVTFTEPMPDNDYEIEYSSNNNPWAGLIFIDEGTKTKNGFNYYIKAPSDESLPVGHLSYTAFKLYTDTEYNNLLNNAVLTSDVTDAVTNGDMNPVTSNAVYDAMNTVTNGTINDTNEYGNTTIEWFKNGRIIIYKIRVSNAITGNSSLWDVSLPQNVRPPSDENGMKTVLGWDGKTAGEAYVYQNSTSIRIAVNGDYDNASGQLIAFI